MLITERGKLVYLTSQIERAGRLQRRHQNALFRAQNLGRLTHEANTGNNQRGGRVITTKPGHFKRVGDAATGLLGQLLQQGVGVVVGNQNGVLCLQRCCNTGLVVCLLCIAKRSRRLGIQVCLNEQTLGNLGHGLYPSGEQRRAAL